MTRLLSLLGAFVLLIASFGQASATTSIDEEVVISYFSTGSFTLSDLSFSGSGLTNIFATSPYAGSGQLVPSGGGILGEQTALLTLNQQYSVFATATFGNSSFNLTGTFTPSDSFQFTSSSGSTSPLSLYTVSSSLSPVPLPASAPLFVLALISLAAFGYHTRRNTIRFAA